MPSNCGTPWCPGWESTPKGWRLSGLSARARAAGHRARPQDRRPRRARGGVVAVRTRGLRVLSYDAAARGAAVAGRPRDELSKTRVHAANRLHRLLAELVPGQGKKNITTGQATTILATVRRATWPARSGVGSPPNRSPSWSRWRRRSRPDQGAQGDGPGLRLHADGAAGVGPVVAAAPWPTPVTSPLHRPQPVRVLDRNRTHRSLQRRDRPAPPLPGREPADEPHRGDETRRAVSSNDAALTVMGSSTEIYGSVTRGRDRTESHPAQDVGLLHRELLVRQDAVVPELGKLF